MSNGKVTRSVIASQGKYFWVHIKRAREVVNGTLSEVAGIASTRRNNKRVGQYLPEVLKVEKDNGGRVFIVGTEWTAATRAYTNPYVSDLIFWDPEEEGMQCEITGRNENSTDSPAVNGSGPILPQESMAGLSWLLN